MPETRKFLIDGRELTVHDLRPGTTLTATVRTTTTPVTVRTRSTAERQGVVRRSTQCDPDAAGRSKQTVQGEKEENVKFTVEGRPGTVFDLRKGMKVSAEKIVEEPDSEITADTSVVGHAPAMRAAAPRAGARASSACAGGY